MNYVKIENDAVSKYPYRLNDLKKDNPYTSFPSNALENSSVQSEFGFETVTPSDAPSKKGYHAVEESPSKSGSSWIQNWKLVAKEAYDVTDDEVEEVEKPVRDGHKAVLGIPELVDGVWKQKWDLEKLTWLEGRIDEYGANAHQIEFITENGLEAWQAKVAEIKAKYPKT